MASVYNNRAKPRWSSDAALSRNLAGGLTTRPARVVRPLDCMVEARELRSVVVAPRRGEAVAVCGREARGPGRGRVVTRGEVPFRGLAAAERERCGDRFEGSGLDGGAMGVVLVVPPARCWEAASGMPVK